MNELVLLGGVVCMFAYNAVFVGARTVTVLFGVEPTDAGTLAIGGGITGLIGFVAVAFLRRTREQDERSTEQSDNYVAWADKRLAFEERRANEALAKLTDMELQFIKQAHIHLRELAEKDQVIMRLQRVNAEQEAVIAMLNSNQNILVHEIETEAEDEERES